MVILHVGVTIADRVKVEGHIDTSPPGPSTQN